MRTIPSFNNEPFTDFSVKSNLIELAQTIEELRQRISKKKLVAHPIIDGNEIETPDVEGRYNPNDGSHFSDISYARLGEVDQTIQSLLKGSTSWSKTSASHRSDLLRKVANLLRERRNFFIALIILEAGKPWQDADIEVAEAIDFCCYYSDMMDFYATPIITAALPGESSVYFYQPRGLTAVISPWNFPLAIACGMTVASLVAGNVTVLKPAEQTSVVGYEFAKLLLESGIPENAFAFLPGRGEVVGRALVDNPNIATICFTGSKDVGMEIIRSASVVHFGQERIKRVIAELGGKNAIIVDSDADLDEALKGILLSAFGYAGQKCSACSRVIGVGSAYEKLLTRLAGATRALIQGPAYNPATLIGPVIDQETQARIIKLIDRLSETHDILVSADSLTPKEGFFVPSVVVKDVDPASELWNNEIFGPVLACAKANTFEEAISFASNSQYALTGAVFSRHPEHLALAREEFAVGNLYINRGCTGALVGRHPFGGFKMSGIGSKAGGPDYLLQFLEPRTVSENTMRRGFTPELS